MDSVPLHPMLKVIYKDWVVVTICLIVILGCIYTMYNIADVQEKCNNHWTEFILKCKCECTKPIINYNTSNEWLIPIWEEINNGNKNNN